MTMTMTMTKTRYKISPLVLCTFVCLIVCVFIWLNTCILWALLYSLECSFKHRGLTSRGVLGQALHKLKTHQCVMHYSGRAIMSESHKIGRNWIVYLMERCNIVKVLRYKTENMGIELQILFHSSLLLSNRFMPTNISLPYNFTLRWILLSQIIHKSLYLPKNNECIKHAPRRIDNSIILILLRTRVRQISY